MREHDRRIYNPKVKDLNPLPATKLIKGLRHSLQPLFLWFVHGQFRSRRSGTRQGDAATLAIEHKMERRKKHIAISSQETAADPGDIPSF